MTKVTVTIEDVEGGEVTLRIEGAGNGATPHEVKMAQRIIRLINKEFKPHITEQIVPHTESITPYRDRPQPN